MDWIANTTFSSVLLRHAPGLGPALRRVDNAFAPWPVAGHAYSHTSHGRG